MSEAQTTREITIGYRVTGERARPGRQFREAPAFNSIRSDVLPRASAIDAAWSLMLAYRAGGALPLIFPVRATVKIDAPEVEAAA